MKRFKPKRVTMRGKYQTVGGKPVTILRTRVRDERLGFKVAGIVHGERFDIVTTWATSGAWCLSGFGRDHYDHPLNLLEVEE